MPSTVEIWNKALTKLGSARVTSTTDDTKQAKSLLAIYDLTRDAELAAHPWTFALKRAELPASATAPAYGWAAAYPLPSDYLAMVEVGEHYVLYEPDEEWFAIEGREVLCDESSPLRMRYIRRVTNAGEFSSLFAEALACRLAAEVSEALTQSLSKKEQAVSDLKDAIRRARRQNAIEMPPRKPPPASWERALIYE